MFHQMGHRVGETLSPILTRVTAVSSNAASSAASVWQGLSQEAKLAGAAVGASVATLALVYLGRRFMRRRADYAKNGSQQPSSRAYAAEILEPSPETEFKLVLCVRQDLKMGKGKIAAQCSHATLGVYRKLAKRRATQAALNQWIDGAQPKVVLRLEDEEEMLDVEARAKAAGLPTHVVIDAGRTQIAPNSRTVLAVGPAPTELINAVTGDLKLL